MLVTSLFFLFPQCFPKPSPSGSVQMQSIFIQQYNETEMGFVQGWLVIYIVEKRENAGYQPFLLFPQYFPKPSFSGSVQIQSIYRQYNEIEMGFVPELWLVIYIVEKRENAGYQPFLLFPQCFQKLPPSGSVQIQSICRQTIKYN